MYIVILQDFLSQFLSNTYLLSVKTHIEEIILGFMLYKTLKPQNFIHGEAKRTYFYKPLFYRFALMPFEKNSINHRTNMLIIGISNHFRKSVA